MSDTKPVEQRIEESVEDRLALQSIVDSGQWYDFDPVWFAGSTTGLKVADLRRVLASVPSQIEAARAEEREACAEDVTVFQLPYVGPGETHVDYVRRCMQEAAAAIRSRGEASK